MSVSTFLLVVLVISVSFSAGAAFAIAWQEWCRGDGVDHHDS